MLLLVSLPHCPREPGSGQSYGLVCTHIHSYPQKYNGLFLYFPKRPLLFSAQFPFFDSVSSLVDRTSTEPCTPFLSFICIIEVHELLSQSFIMSLELVPRRHPTEEVVIPRGLCSRQAGCIVNVAVTGALRG